MYRWTKKLHMYAGLLTFSAFVIWGITGIHGAFTPPPGEGGPPEISSTVLVPLEVPGDLTDAELARFIYDRIDIPLRGGHYNIHRDDDANLAFFVFTANGRRDVTYLEDQRTVRLAIRQNALTGFFSTMHTAHSRRGPTTPAARAWGFYNEFSTWAFLFMTVSGVYLWLDTRPRLRWAQLIAATALASAALLWWATR